MPGLSLPSHVRYAGQIACYGMSTVLAVDFGGTKTAAAQVDENGGVSNKTKAPAARTLRESVAQVVERCGAVDAIGVVVPGIYNARTGLAWAPNLWGWDEVPLRDALAAAVSVPVVIDSDRAGYVLGEQWLGVAQHCRDVVFVAIGTGIGAGIIANSRLVRGARGIAGAVGWLALDPRWQEAYAQMGCWETEAAGPSMARQAAAPTAELVVQAARAGEPRAFQVLDRVTDYLAMGVANLISTLNPEMVVLGGGLMQAGSLLLDMICRKIPRWAQPIAARDTQIRLTSLGEDAGLLGAARLAFLDQGIHPGEIHVG